MTEMTAFERQLSGEITDLMGPVRPVDDAAIFTAITATKSPRWRLQPMLGATGFVVAAAIVALFGGFLLIGLLTQPSADPAQAPGAASSPQTPSAGPTGTPEAPSASDLMARLELDGRGLPPGVYRVTGDGERRFPRLSADGPLPEQTQDRVWDVAVTPDGEVWVMTGRAVGLSNPFDRVRVVRLGEPGVVFEENGLSDSYATGLQTRSDGSVGVMVGGRVKVPVGLDGTEVAAAYERCRWGLVEDAPGSSLGHTTPDGTCWANGWDDLRRMGTDGAVTSVTASDVGASADSSLFHVTVDATGTLWAALISSSGGFEGLVRYDGQAWTSVPFDGDPGLRATDVAVSPTGVAWATIFDRQAREIFVASWDGETWTTYGPVRWRTIFLPPGTHFLPDGSAWFASGVVFFDGSALREGVARIEMTSSNTSPSSAFGPDGLVWTMSLGDGYGLYLITPEAVATTD